ncbi:MAG TPA: hypothetical protein PLH98_11475 [Ruminococcus flavefaciens]|nr:hypothetical protein [Ruminococcus flavefaciens]
MKIETKYNVGDEVWVVERSYGDIKYYTKRAFVWAIKINVYAKEEANIGYELQDHYVRCFYDKELFATEDEAEFECIRLNEILEREKRGE